MTMLYLTLQNELLTFSKVIDHLPYFAKVLSWDFRLFTGLEKLLGKCLDSCVLLWKVKLWKCITINTDWFERKLVNPLQIRFGLKRIKYFAISFIKFLNKSNINILKKIGFGNTFSGFNYFKNIYIPRVLLLTAYVAFGIDAHLSYWNLLMW